MNSWTVFVSRHICHSGNTYKYSGRINQRTARACWLVSSGNNRSSAICKNWATLCELIACERWPGIWSAEQQNPNSPHILPYLGNLPPAGKNVRITTYWLKSCYNAVLKTTANYNDYIYISKTLTTNR